MKLILDVSELTKTAFAARETRGIPRVIEKMMEGLDARLGGDVSYSAVGNPYAAWKYLQTRDKTKGSRLVQRSGFFSGDAFHHYMARGIQWTRENPRKERDFLRALLKQLSGTVRRESEKINPVHLRNADIFHSTFLAIPPCVQEHEQLSVFLTVYDLIPVLHPEMIAPKYVQFARNIFSSLRPDRPRDFALCISESVKRDFCDYYRFPEERVRVVPLAADPHIFYPCPISEESKAARAFYGIGEEPYFLSLCIMEPRKNIELLVRSFAALIHQEKSEPFLLVLAGRLPVDRLKALYELIEECKIKSKVILTGYVEEAHLAALYSGATAFVFPSLAEGFGLPPLEAMQCGTPVICSDLPVFQEVAGDAAIRVNPRSEEEMAAAMLHCSRGDDLRQTLRQKGLERSRLFNWDRCMDQTMEAYRLAE